MGARKDKIRRLKKGARPRVLDLFAGCGGLSLGFHTAGFDIVGAIENEPRAARSHALNFHPEEVDAEDSPHGKGIDIRDEDPGDFLEKLGADEPELSVDVLIGGPPCQAYARVGRAKLREVDAHPEAFLNDTRGNLYLRYLDYVRKLEPVALLVENVPDVLNYGGHNVADEICEVLDGLGYTAGYTLLNSAFYGVPQMRERVFLVAYAEELEAEPEFPDPTHWIELPSGYRGARQVALKNVSPGLFDQEREMFYRESPESSPDLPPAVTAKQALQDLPEVTRHLEGRMSRGARRFDELYPYPDEAPVSAFGKLMRNWPGFESEEGVYDHVIRYLPRDYPIFRRMEPGDQYPEAHQKAQRMFEERLAELREQGEAPEEGSEEYEELKSDIVPPYDPSKFPNKWRKMEADEPARTLMAHLGKDSYSHIHYDSAQARTISVREAARLQSFPDGFVFEGPMNPAFRQIGNAVPPLLAYRLADRMRDTLGVEAPTEEERERTLEPV